MLCVSGRAPDLVSGSQQCTCSPLSLSATRAQAATPPTRSHPVPPSPVPALGTLRCRGQERQATLGLAADVR